MAAIASDELPDWGEAAEIAFHTIFPHLAVLLLLQHTERLRGCFKSGGAIVRKLTRFKLRLQITAPCESMTKAYPSNLTWEQWELISDLFPEAKTGGRPLPRGDAPRT